MDLLKEVIVIVTPSLMVLFIGFYLIKYQIEAKFNRHGVEPMVGPRPRPHVNFQAYERLVLYLERINPSNLALRMHKPGISSKMLEAEMVKSIRDEFEHNLSQQIYVSDDIWKLIKRAKEETIKLIGIASSKCDDKSTGTELSRIILEIASNVEEFPHDVAIRYLKKELRVKG
jgi:hypothetical protein